MRENEAVQLTHDELTSLLDAFDEFGFTELELTVGDTHVELRSGDGTRPEPAEPSNPHRSSIHHVTAPTVGLVRLTPAATPDLKVGPDDVLGVLEVWTSSVEVKAGVAGVVRTVDVEEGTLAEYGQPLVGIEPIDR